MKLWPWPRRATETKPPGRRDLSFSLHGVTDIHCHVLPGIDDGAPDLNTALQMCRIAIADGISTVVATPHTLDGVFDVERSSAHAALVTLRKALVDEGLSLDLRLAGEVRFDDRIPELLERAPDISLDGHGRYLLIELPHTEIPPTLSSFLFRLAAAGTTPVIAHPERNLGVRANPEVTEQWVRSGVLLQVTAGSLTGRFGPVIGACAEHLLRAGRVHVLATDAHSLEKRAPRVQGAAEAAARIVGEAGARALLVDNPAHIVAGDPLSSVAAPQPAPRRRVLTRGIQR